MACMVGLGAFALYLTASKFDNEWYVIGILVVAGAGTEGAKELIKRWRKP